MRKTVFILLTVLAVLPATAQKRSPEEMRAIAVAQLAGNEVKAADTRPGRVQLQELRTSDNYAVFGDEAVGLVVVSRDEASAPILGYSLRPFQADNLPCGLRWWLEAMDAADGAVLRREAASAYPNIENFVNTTWGQETPYNNLCPTVNGKLPPCGCVATAMAQVMYFFKYPAQGQGSGYYTLGSSSSRIPRKVEAVYEWEKMLDAYTTQISTTRPEAATAVATLMADVGAAVHMQYNTSGSGAYTQDCARAAVNNFLYDPLAIRHYYRDYFSNEEWMATIVNELKLGRPVLYAASDAAQGGHAFVLSGVNTDGLVYVNWGWDGAADGYYSIDNMNPTGILGTSYPYHFNQSQHLVCGFKAQPEPDDEDVAEGDFVVMSQPFTATTMMRNYLTLNVDSWLNMGLNDFLGTVGYLVTDADGSRANELYLELMNVTEPVASGSGYYGSQLFKSIAALPEGEYHIYMAFKGTEETDYQKMRAQGGVYYIPFEKAADGTLTIGEGGIVTAIRDLTPFSPSSMSASSSLPLYFDLSGRSLPAAPARGTFIVRDGEKVRKVVR